MEINKLKINPDNPRFIKDDKFKKLCNSIKEFPKMMVLRPIIVDNDNIIIGGNMRYRALKELGYKEIPDQWVKKADELTEKERQRFIITDNSGFGEWDYDILANNWDADKLIEWGVDVPDGWGEEIEPKEKILKPYEKIHILISIPVEKFQEISEFLNEIKKNDFVEYDQSDN